MIVQAVILVVVIAAAHGDDECMAMVRSRQCLNVDTLRPISDLAGFPDKEFLNENCSPVIQMVECMKDSVEKCPEVIEFVRHQRALEKLLDLLRSMCDDDSELKKGYLENVECYNSIFSHVMECENSSYRTVANFRDSLENVTFEDRPYIHCVQTSLLYSCFLLETATECGLESVSPMANITEQAFSIQKASQCHDEDKLTDFEAGFILYIAEQALSELRK